jgi:hypothetical protein
MLSGMMAAYTAVVVGLVLRALGVPDKISSG